MAGSTVALSFSWRERDKQRPICQKTSLFGLAGQNQLSALSFIPFPFSLFLFFFFFFLGQFSHHTVKEIQRERETEGFFCQKPREKKKANAYSQVGFHLPLCVCFFCSLSLSPTRKTNIKHTSLSISVGWFSPLHC